ncbi:TPA_asm: glycoprotein [finepatterned puffer bornavirus]|uniref:Glycoprotein n=1 Tax=finepatterned puffer bornavirus TaxID=3055758 RepID=A0AA48P900_9MONO|nr:TPA_asm: glycoprotein [finepatterned puffer bornavirus]
MSLQLPLLLLLQAWTISMINVYDCDTQSSPHSILISIPPPPNRNASTLECEVTEHRAKTVPLEISISTCRTYTITTTWSGYPTCNFHYRPTKLGDSCRLVESYPADPCDDWWYRSSGVDIWWFGSHQYSTYHCLCNPMKKAVAALSTRAPHLYCSFEDCSTCTADDMAAGICKLPTGTEITFTKQVIEKPSTKETMRLPYFPSPPHVMSNNLHASYPLDSSYRFHDDDIDIRCKASRRAKRDTTQQYILDLINPILDKSVVTAERLSALQSTILSQPLMDYTPFLRKVLKREDIVGVVNQDVGLYWECKTVQADLKEWAEDTFYPPVSYKNSTMYLQPYTSVMYSSSPRGPHGLYVLIRSFSSLYLGVIGSNTKPLPFSKPSRTVTVATKLPILDSLNDARTVAHYVDPAGIAIGPRIDDSASEHEMSQYASNQAALHSMGLSYLNGFDPLFTAKDFLLKICHIGGFLFILKMLYTLVTKIVNFVKHGKFVADLYRPPVYPEGFDMTRHY